MRRLTSLAAIGASLLVLGASMYAPAVLAASGGTGTGEALEIGPPIMTLTANPGQVLKTQIQLRDVTSGNLVVTNEIDDFVAAGEDGTPKILTGNDTNDPFTMKSWITPLPSFTLTPSQIQTLSLTISVPKNASPGGHYGVIRFTGIPPQLKGTGVSLSASIGTLVLLTVSGQLTHKLSVTEFAAAKSIQSKPSKLFQATPLTFIVKLQNSGNIQEEPFGHIVVTDMFGRAVGSTNINVPPRNILPDSTREFFASLDPSNLGSRKLFGLYHAKLTTTYGSSNIPPITNTISFWVIPYKLIAIIIILLVIVFFAIRFMLHRYKKSIIKQTTHRTAKQPTKRRRM